MEEARKAAFERLLGHRSLRAQEEAKSDADAVIETFLSALMDTGYAIVPREPTEAMIVAAVAERHGQPVPEAWSLATVNIYRAMLASAPPLKE